VLINALHAALEDAEIAFDGVGVRVAANVFLVTVVDALVAGVSMPLELSSFVPK
jgi:hypothetical protein